VIKLHAAESIFPVPSSLRQRFLGSFFLYFLFPRHQLRVSLFLSLNWADSCPFNSATTTPIDPVQCESQIFSKLNSAGRGGGQTNAAQGDEGAEAEK